MIEFFAHKPIRCTHCEFEFTYSIFGRVTKIVCPACGEENILPAPVIDFEPKTDSLKTDSPKTESTAPIAPHFMEKSPSEKSLAILCSAEQCPLLTGDSNNIVTDAVAEQMKLRLQKKGKRRKTILAWTVALQLGILIIAVLFSIQALMIPDEKRTASQTSDESTTDRWTVIKSSEPVTHSSPQPMPVHHRQAEETKNEAELFAISPLPLPSASEPKMATPKTVTPAEIPPTLPVQAKSLDDSESITSPFDLVQNIYPPPVYEYQMQENHAENPDDDSLSSPQEVPSLPAMISTTSTPSLDEQSSPEPAQPVATIESANALLATAETLSVSDPEECIAKAVSASQIYEQLGQSPPNSLYWVLSNAFASLTWGESLLESSSAVETMTLSSDNRWLIAQLENKTVWLWDLHLSGEQRTGFMLDTGEAKTEYVKFVFTPNLRWVFGGQKNGTIRIWDMTLKNPADTVITLSERIPDLKDLTISPDGQWLAAFGNSPQRAIVSADRMPHQPPRESVQQVSFQRLDRSAHYGLPQYPVLLWNLKQMESRVIPIAMFLPHVAAPVQIVQFSSSSNQIAVGREDRVVRIYDLTPQGVNGEPFILRGHQLPVTQIAFAPSGHWVATGSQDNTVRLWNLTSTKISPESATLYGHVGWISTLTTDKTGEYLFSGSYDRTIRIWTIKRDRIGTALGTEPIVLETDLGVPVSLFLTQDSGKMIVQGGSGCLGIYDLPSALEGNPDEPLMGVTFRNSKLLISKSWITTDDQLLIFSYEHSSDSSRCGIRLWPLQPQAFVQ